MTNCRPTCLQSISIRFCLSIVTTRNSPFNKWMTTTRRTTTSNSSRHNQSMSLSLTCHAGLNQEQQTVMICTTTTGRQARTEDEEEGLEFADPNIAIQPIGKRNSDDNWDYSLVEMYGVDDKDDPIMIICTVGHVLIWHPSSKHKYTRNHQIEQWLCTFPPAKRDHVIWLVIIVRTMQFQ